MLSAATIMSVLLTLVGLYVFWRLLKAMTLVFSIAAVCAGLVLLWAHSDEPSNENHAKPVAEAVSPDSVLVEQGARLIAKPLNLAAKQVVEATEDEEALVQNVRQSGVQFQNIIEMARAFAQGTPISDRSLAEKTANP